MVGAVLGTFAGPVAAVVFHLALIGPFDARGGGLGGALYAGGAAGFLLGLMMRGAMFRQLGLITLDGS